MSSTGGQQNEKQLPREAIARFPLLACVENFEDLEEVCYVLEGLAGGFASFVDNLWVPHDSVETAEQLLGRLRTLLRCRWQLDFGPGSLSIMPCKHYPGDFDSGF